MKNKKVLIIVSSLVIVVLILVIGHSYSFSNKEIDLNLNGEADVGDVVKMRKLIMGNNTKYSVRITGTNVEILNNQNVKVLANASLKVYLVTNERYEISGVTCTNGQTADYSNNLLTISNITNNTVCTVNTIDLER